MGTSSSLLSVCSKTDIKIKIDPSAGVTPETGMPPTGKAHDPQHLAPPKPGAPGNKKGTTKQPSGTSYGLEEFVNYDGVQVVYGKLGEKGEDHALYKSDYVLLRDHQLDIVMPQSVIRESADVYLSSQLNIQQFKDFAVAHGDQHICRISLRAEPVLFLETGSVPSSTSLHLFSVKCKRPFELYNFRNEEAVWDFELETRKQISSLTSQEQGFQYYESLSSEPTPFYLVGDDDLLTLSEHMAELNTQPLFSCVRCPFPQHGLPELSSIDQLVSAAMQCPQHLLLLEDKDFSSVKSQFAVCIALVVRGYCKDIRPATEGSPALFANRAVEKLVTLLTDGELKRYQIDQLLTAMSTSTYVSTMQHTLTSLSAKYLQGHNEEFTAEELYSTQLYVMLIIFNDFWHATQGQAEVFSTWLQKRCTLLGVFSATCCPLVPNISAGLGKSLILVNNSKHYEDQLCTLDFNMVANLRGIPKLPIYGVCQPSKQGMIGLTTHLKNLKHRHIYLVSVRDDATVIGDGEVYCLRSNSWPRKCLSLNHACGEEMRSFEKELASIATERDIMEIVPDDKFSESPKWEAPFDFYSAVDDVTYAEVPLPLDSSPSGQAFQLIQDIVEKVLNTEGGGKPPAMVFFCDTGRDRTTTAMSMAGLAFCNVKGYGHGAAKGEVERIAIWNALYTRGEFKIIQKVVSAMPFGHQSKREVDYILDQCFETSSMMHYHVREEVFVLFNKGDKLKPQLAGDPTGEASICVRGPVKGSGMEMNLHIYYNQLHKKALDNLERYSMLVVYNHYLKNCLPIGEEYKRMPFTDWLDSVGFNAKLPHLLDNIQFVEFEPKCNLRFRVMRNCFLPALHRHRHD